MRIRPKLRYVGRRPTARYILPGGNDQGPRWLWGDGADPASTPSPTGTSTTPGASSSAAYYEQIGQLIGGYTSSQDVRVKLEIARADLAALQKQIATTPPALASLLMLNSRLARKDAEVRALSERLAVQLRAEQETSQWHSLGQTGVGVGIVGGVLAVGILAVLGARLARKDVD